MAESQAKIDIVLFPEQGEGKDSAIQAFSDKSLPFSIISRGMLTRLGVKFTSCKGEAVKDAKGAQYSPVGKVDLRWHKKGIGKSHAEPFRVVDKNTLIVILGASAFPNYTKPSGGTVQPIGVHQQTTEQRRTQETKKLEAAQRREKEKREQEEKEAERRRQDK